MGRYMSLQGRVYLGELDANGNPINVKPVGNVSEMALQLNTETVDHYESMSGQRLLDDQLMTQKTATLSLTAEEWTKESMALCLYGKPYDVEAGTAVAGEVVGAATLVVGERYFLAHQNVETVAVEDSSATAVTLVEGTDYTVDTKYGAIQMLRLADGATTFTGPLKVTYQTGATSNISMFTAPAPERYLRFEGVNTANGDAPVLLELFRVKFSPVSDLGLISNEYNSFQMSGGVLADTNKPSDGELGQFGRFVIV